MNAEFYLFNVDHGQCAALRLPNGRWCIFDLGRTSTFSPIEWIVEKETRCANQIVGSLSLPYPLCSFHRPFRFLKATVSHLHGDHLADYATLFRYGPEFFKTVDADHSYLTDCYVTCADESSKARLQAFYQQYASAFSPAVFTPNYGGVQISELCLSPAVARQVGGDANARVNNASVVTRIDVYGNSILLCGDMEKEAWEAIIRDSGDCGRIWRPFVSNIDILVAPHHGHRSAYSTDLLNLAKPAVVLVSVVSRDPNVDSRYSQAPVRGLNIGGATYTYISTRQKGHVKIRIQPPNILSGHLKGATYWTFGDAALQ